MVTTIRNHSGEHIDNRGRMERGSSSVTRYNVYFGGHPLLALKGKLPFRVTFPDGHFPVTDSI